MEVFIKNGSSWLIVASLVVVGNAFGADWKFYGGGQADTKEEFYSFYDSESIKVTNGVIRVWVKSALYRDIEKLGENKKLNKAIVEKSAVKVVDRYASPYSKVTPEIDYKGNINIIAWEETANHPSLKTTMKIFYEINCSEKVIRELSMSFTKKGGKPFSSDIPRDWHHIPPESSAETLHKILCNS